MSKNSNGYDFMPYHSLEALKEKVAYLEHEMKRADEALVALYEQYGIIYKREAIGITANIKEYEEKLPAGIEWSVIFAEPDRIRENAIRELGIIKMHRQSGDSPWVQFEIATPARDMFDPNK